MAEEKGKFFEDKTVKKSKRGCFTCGSCFLILLILFIALIIYLTSLVASSGIITIPVFGKIFFKNPPQPSRIVEPASADSLSKKLENQLMEAMKNKTNLITLDLGENEITGLLNNLASQPNSPVEKVQIAIEPDGLELFIKTAKLSPALNSLYYTALINPKVVNNQLDFEIKKFKVGNLSFPTQIANFAKNYGLNYLKTRVPFYKELNLDEIKLENKQIKISGRPNLEKLLAPGEETRK